MYQECCGNLCKLSLELGRLKRKKIKQVCVHELILLCKPENVNILSVTYSQLMITDFISCKCMFTRGLKFH